MNELKHQPLNRLLSSRWVDRRHLVAQPFVNITPFTRESSGRTEVPSCEKWVGNGIRTHDPQGHNLVL